MPLVVFTEELKLAMDAEGGALAMESRTVSLFISGSSGDRWRCVPAHRPPVHAVRFVESAS